MDAMFLLEVTAIMKVSTHLSDLEKGIKVDNISLRLYYVPGKWN